MDVQIYYSRTDRFAPSGGTVHAIRKHAFNYRDRLHRRLADGWPVCILKNLTSNKVGGRLGNP